MATEIEIITKIAEKISEICIEQCAVCKQKDECWANPSYGLPNTIDFVFRHLDEHRSIINTLIAIMILKRMRAPQK